MLNALTRMNPPTLPDAGEVGYSQITIAEANRLAFVSGQVASDTQGSPVPETLEAQVEQVISNLTAALKAVNASTHDIVQMRIYVMELNDEAMAITMPQITRFLDGAQPSLTGIGVAALASPALKIEVEMVVQVQP